MYDIVFHISYLLVPLKFILVAEEKYISMLSFDIPEERFLLPLPIKSNGVVDYITYDRKNHFVYWTQRDPPAIWQSQFNGDNQRAIVTESIALPEGLVISDEGTNLYWTDSSIDKIEVVSLFHPDKNPLPRRTLINTDVYHPIGLAINESIGYMQYTCCIPICTCTCCIPICTCTCCIPICTCTCCIPICTCTCCIPICTCTCCIPICTCTCTCVLELILFHSVFYLYSVYSRWFVVLLCIPAYIIHVHVYLTFLLLLLLIYIGITCTCTCIILLYLCYYSYIYWTDIAPETEGLVEKATKDGLSRTDIHSGNNLPGPITVDSRTGTLYWADSHPEKLGVWTLSGNGDAVNIVPLTGQYVTGLSVLDTTLYWTDRINGIVYSKRLDVLALDNIVADNLGKVTDITSVDGEQSLSK